MTPETWLAFGLVLVIVGVVSFYIGRAPSPVDWFDEFMRERRNEAYRRLGLDGRAHRVEFDITPMKPPTATPHCPNC